MLEALDEARRRGAQAAPVALGRAAGRRDAGGRPARAPGGRRRRDRRLGPAAGRDLQGHRPDRHRDRPRSRWQRRWSPIHSRRRPAIRGPRAPGSPPTTGSRWTCGSSLRTPTATSSSTSPARRRTTSSCASARSGRGSRYPSTGSPRPRPARSARYATEAEVYGRLGLAYIEPELREGRGEIAAAAEGSLPDLVSRDDIRGDLHCHTTLSDGRNTLEEMAEAARDRGYAYLAITDHSASHGFGDDVPAGRLWERIEEIRELNDEQLREPLQGARRLGGEHPPGRLARLRRRSPRRPRLGRGKRPHLVPDLRARR